eukprot:2727492-Alexandrium_andersonii.AAC.1
MCAKPVWSSRGARAAPSATMKSSCFVEGAKCVVHGDDFTFAGHDEDLDLAQRCVDRHFLHKFEGRLA